MTEIVPGTGELRAGGSSVQATMKVVSLAQDADSGDFKDLDEEKWRALNAQRWWMLAVIGGLFVLLNTAVVGLICFAMRTDARLITAHDHRAHGDAGRLECPDRRHGRPDWGDRLRHGEVPVSGEMIGPQQAHPPPRH